MRNRPDRIRPPARPLRGAVLAALALFATAAVPGATGSAAAATDCDRFASPAGSNDGSGSLGSPFATANRLLGSLGQGDVGCFRAGTYEFSELRIDTAAIKLAPYGNERVTLRGAIKIPPGGARTVIEGLRLVGTGGASPIGPRLYADGVVLRDNEITNNHTSICIMVGQFYSQPAPRGIVIERNLIHDCGRLPATNFDHGIYLSEARNTVVRDNWIYGNADRGIQQYPATHGSVITGNVIVGNGQGVNFGGSESGSCSNDNTVSGNVIAHSKVRWNAYSGAEGPTCVRNELRDNCLFASNNEDYYNANGGIEPQSRSFDTAANLVARPAFAGPANNDYRLAVGSTCLAKYQGTLSSPGGELPRWAGASNHVALRVGRRKVREGARIRMRGTVSVAAGRRASHHVAIERRARGGWRAWKKVRLRDGSRYRAKVRAKGHGRLRIRATVKGVGHSRTVKVRLK
jgi:hypothetical protein